MSHLGLRNIAIGYLIVSTLSAASLYGATIYVSPSGTNDVAARYNTWEGAAQDIGAAVALAVANDEVVVTNGAYPVSTNLYVTNFTVRSVNGPDVTTVYRTSGDYPVFRLAHSNAWMSGFTVTNASYTQGGGAIHMTAGTVSNCVMTRNFLRAGNGNGTAWMSGGLMTGCIFSNNTPRSWGVTVAGGTLENSVLTLFTQHNDDAPLVLSAGTVRRCRIVANSPSVNTRPNGVNLSGSGRLENCLVWGNSGGIYGGVWMSGGTMVNCTVASNSVSAGSSAGGVYRTGGTMTNCVVYGNQSGYANYSGAASAATYSCAPELTLGAQGNVTDNPRFVNLAAGDCRLSFGSSAVNSGTNTGLTVDLEGTNRDTQYDMGAYERVPAGGALAVAFSGLPQTGIGSVTSVFTAVLEGSNTNVTSWGWDFNNDGGFEATGSGLQTVTNIFFEGRHSISVWVANGVPEEAAWTNLDYVTVQSTGTYVFVATNGSNTFPYDTWSKAATNLAEACASAAYGGMTVWVSNGVYDVTAGINLSTNITVRSLNGPNVTTVYRPDSAGTGFAIFNLSHSNAWVSGFIITNGFWSANNDCGGSIHMTAGTVTNCWIINTRFIGGTQSGAVYMNGGLMTACLISNSVPRSFALKLAGGTIEDSILTRNTDPYDESPVRVFGGTMRRCKVLYNRSQGGTAVGPVWLSSGLLENCLIYGNVSLNNGAGGVGQGGGRMVNCTIASNSNSSATVGAGVHRSGGTLTNCIVYGNSGPSGLNFSGAATSTAYSCAPELTNSVQGNITNNPQFISLTTGDCHLQKTSPCLNKGYTDTAMRSTIDLDGTPRVRQGNTDMGCYETAPSAGTLLLLQ